MNKRETEFKEQEKDLKKTLIYNFMTLNIFYVKICYLS